MVSVDAARQRPLGMHVLWGFIFFSCDKELGYTISFRNVLGTCQRKSSKWCQADWTIDNEAVGPKTHGTGE